MTKISALSDIGTSVASNDTFVLVDVSDPTTPNKKIQQQNLFLIPDGSAGTPGLRFLSDTNVGVFRPTTDTLAIATGGSERLRIDSSGRLGLGTSSPSVPLDLNYSNSSTYSATTDVASSAILFNINATANTYAALKLSTYGSGSGSAVGSVNLCALASSTPYGAEFVVQQRTTSGTFRENLRITHDGKVGIGTTPAYTLDVAGNVQFGSSSNSVGLSRFIGSNYHQIYSDGTFYFDAGTSKEIIFRNNGGSNEAFRVDSSRRLLVGTPTALTNVLIKGDLVSSAATTPQQQFALAANNYNAGLSVINYSASGYGGVISLNSSKSNTLGTNTLVDNTVAVGTISFNGNDGTNFVPCAEIKAAVDGTPGSNDMPGRLVFATTADGASNPTERMRIKSTGIINFANVPTYADNTAALAGGLVAGDVYRKSDGTLMITY